MYDAKTIIPKYLSSQNGHLAYAEQSRAHTDLQGCEATNDKFAESVFGVFFSLTL